MTTIRRISVVVALAVAVVIGSGLPASATLSDTTRVSTTIGTVSVAAPTQISTQQSWCTNGVLNADVTWTASTTAKVSGYTVTAYYQAGEVRVLANVSSTATEYASVVPNQGSSKPLSISLTTKTTYGWSTESARIPVPPC